MDPPPPLPPHPTTVAPVIPTTTNQPDSANSSPRSRPDTWDEPLPPVPGAKLRLMCSYGGHIIPRPHDKSLCYVGGDTRIVVVDRRSSLVDFLSRLSHFLLNGRHFTLKYQLPNEELDSLISVSTDEDLENMIEEYDRTTAASPLKPSRLRLFLFPSMPETATSMGSLLDDAKSETWFVDALNGTGLIPRGVSDSAAIDNLVELDGIQKSDSSANLDAENENLGFNKQMAGLDERFSHLSIAPNAPPPTHSVIDVAATVSSVAGVNTAASTGEHLSRVTSDNEKSYHGAPTGLRKPPLPLQPVQPKVVDIYNSPSPDSKHGGGYSLPSPDSVASDSSIASAPSLSKHHTIYQDATQLSSLENRVSAPVTDHNNTNQDPPSQYPVQQFSGSLSIPSVHQNQQFIHPGTHYIPYPDANQLPLSSYYPMYLHQTQQPHQTDPQYPMYFLPVNQSQPYNLNGAVPSNIADSIVTSSRPLTPPLNQAHMAPSGATYAETIPSAYPSTAATTMSKPEMGSNIYRTTATGGPMLVQVPSHQFHQQYVGVSQIPNPSQSTAAPATANYAPEYTHLTNEQVYYAQNPPPAPSQYHTMTPAAAVMLSQVSTQMPPDGTANQIRTS